MAAAMESSLLSASGLSSDQLSLPVLQSRMKLDPRGYLHELTRLRANFESSLDLFRHRSAAISAAPDPAVCKRLGDLAMLLSHVAPFYPGELADFPGELAELLKSEARQLPSTLRCQLTHALILLANRKLLAMDESLELFMELQILGDRTVRKLAFSHVVHSIRRMNQKHKDERKNRKLQNILFTVLQDEDESRAKRSLVVLCDLHRRKVWFDDRTANAICNACFHSSSRIMIAALSFLLDYEQVQEDGDSDESSDEDDATLKKPQVVLSREDVYKANSKGTAASKKKKKAKLQRVARSMKRQQRLASQNSNSNLYSPLTHLKDAQGFAEKLFSRLQRCNERFEIKMMMLKVIARTVGLHRLILLNFYPFLQKYVQPHQRDVTTLLAAAIQACHDMVPPDAVEPLFKQIVNQFVHDRSRTEAITVGLNAVREICLRMPLLMNEDLLQDLVLYKKSHEKSVSSAARSLITLFREICPSLLVKKDRGRPVDPKARPKAFGEVSVASNVPGVELLQQVNDDDVDDSDDSGSAPSDSDAEDRIDKSNLEGEEEDDSVQEHEVGDNMVSKEDDGEENEGKHELEASLGFSDDMEGDEDDNDSDGIDNVAADDVDDHVDEGDSSNEDNDEEDSEEEEEEEEDEDDDDDDGDEGDHEDMVKPKVLKRKFADLNKVETSLRALKKLAGSKLSQVSSDANDCIYSNEDFQRIKELKAKEEAKWALVQHGLVKKPPSAEQLSMKRLDPSELEVNIKRRLSKEEKLALARAGREERGKYQSRTAVKQKKTGGLSNRQKEHKKAMPFAARKAKAARSRQEKKKQRSRAGKQFRGRKAWK